MIPTFLWMSKIFREIFEVLIAEMNIAYTYTNALCNFFTWAENVARVVEVWNLTF
jgi:hypothetical protein